MSDRENIVLGQFLLSKEQCAQVCMVPYSARFVELRSDGSNIAIVIAYNKGDKAIPRLFHVGPIKPGKTHKHTTHCRFLESLPAEGGWSRFEVCYAARDLVSEKYLEKAFA